jgi:hypothetical protein
MAQGRAVQYSGQGSAQARQGAGQDIAYGSMDLRNFGKLIPVNMVLQPRRQPSS